MRARVLARVAVDLGAAARLPVQLRAAAAAVSVGQHKPINIRNLSVCGKTFPCRMAVSMNRVRRGSVVRAPRDKLVVELQALAGKFRRKFNDTETIPALMFKVSKTLLVLLSRTAKTFVIYIYFPSFCINICSGLSKADGGSIKSIVSFKYTCYISWINIRPICISSWPVDLRSPAGVRRVMLHVFLELWGPLRPPRVTRVRVSKLLYERS